MAYLSRKTFHIIKYGDRRIKKLWDDHFHVDDLIAPVIQLLNRKGYFTEMCCAGGEHKQLIDGNWHKPVFDKCYILFKKSVSLPSLPPGFFIEPFKIENFASCLYIIKVCDTQHDKTMNQLYEWALDLPIYINE